MEKWTFSDLARKVLEEEKKPLSPEEIWELAKSKGYDKNVGSQGKTPWRTIGAQIYVNIRDDKNSPFIKVGAGPTRFYLRSLVKDAEELKRLIEAHTPKSVLPPKKFGYLERDLHPFVTYYAMNRLRAYTKTIQHSKSDKKEFGEWVHPDMVGCHFMFEDLERDVFDLSKEIGSIAAKLYSFEIKRDLDFSNLREAFFQSVSNSSWANEGYLVASKISDDKDFHEEVKRLSTSFGIGVIKLDLEDPDSSDVLLPAESKEYLDWDTINKLTMNPDFLEFLNRVR